MSRNPTIGMFVGDEEIERRRQKRLNQIEPTVATAPPDFTEQDRSLLRELYETQRELPNRNFARDHSFEEWLQHRRRR